MGFYISVSSAETSYFPPVEKTTEIRKRWVSEMVLWENAHKSTCVSWTLECAHLGGASQAHLSSWSKHAFSGI